ncbi:hypothetical protein PENTCL1PPCAC_23498 [Pristionchus entomophagus]|uniref:ADP ribosylation factor n=1 Tax=Pristionchus entomophagus TaxID=358040 RepID=A0AAV5U391_9BILA|nr:hypothetical protein PENTCL1PPCAC_23498 [Pristionchus entomophagus]
MMLTPPPSSSSSTSSSPPPSSILPPTFLSSSTARGGPPTPPMMMSHSPYSLTTSRPPALYYDEESRAGYREMDAAGWYDSMLQLQPAQQNYRTLQHRRPATTIERSSRVEQLQPRQPLAPLNWEVPQQHPQQSQIRGRPREIKRGAATVKGRTGSQAPDLTRSSLVTDHGKEEKKGREEKGGLRRSARRSLSRSRLIQAVLAVPRKANEGISHWWRDEEKERSVEDYLPSSPALQQQQQAQHYKSSSHLFSTAAAAASPASPAASHYSAVRPTSVRSSRPPPARTMRVVVVGAKRVGKTAILRQVACIEDVTKKPYTPTIEDTYQVLLEDGDKPREILIFHDTAGLMGNAPAELKRPYLQVADAFVLVYSVTDHESFNRVDTLKKIIDKHYAKEKKEMPIVVLGNMTDLPGRKVDSEFALNWSQREKVKLFEVTATDRNSLIDFVHYIGQRHFHPQKESKFSLSKKLKSEKSNNAILMDF